MAHAFRLQMKIYEEHGDAHWQDEMARIAKTSQAFLDELEAAEWTIYSFGRIKFGKRQLWLHELTTKILRVFVRLSAGYQSSAAQKDRRKKQGPRANFIVAVSEQLKIAGYGVSARANDDLVRVLDLLFESAGYPVSDTRKTVAHALDAMGTDHL